jgi:hypothetical protein
MIGAALRHEVTHTVFATQFRDRLAAWADEGIASLSDDPERVAVRKKTLSWFAKTGNWPDIADVLNARAIQPADRAANTIATSLTEYLLTRGDRGKFVRFAVDGKRDGWDAALTRHYGLKIKDFQIDWQAWATKGVK